jgi:acyl-coenzyme A thioesterase PaaI-like protein
MGDAMEPWNIQDKYYPRGICFGCGPTNEKGLRIKSYVDGDKVVARWKAEPHHQAFEGVLCGGIIGTLLDCHSNWTSAWHLMVRNGLDQPPCTVTGEFAVKLLKPTPIDDAVYLSAVAVESTHNKAVVEATLSYRGEVTATCRGTFFAVKPGHPAYHQR